MSDKDKPMTDAQAVELTDNELDKVQGGAAVDKATPYVVGENSDIADKAKQGKQLFGDDLGILQSKE